MAPQDVPLQDCCDTPFGLFEFLHMLFGLKNAAQAFQISMSWTRGVPFCVHRRHSRCQLQRQRTPTSPVPHLPNNYGLIVNNIIAKCIFGVNCINFLGHRVTAQGIEPLPERVEAVCQFPQPQDAKALCEFLGGTRVVEERH